MFATIKSLIPEPRQADQPRRYVGRHRRPDTVLRMVPDQTTEPNRDPPTATGEPRPVPVGMEK